MFLSETASAAPYLCTGRAASFTSVKPFLCHNRRFGLKWQNCRRDLQCLFAGMACSARSPACTPDRRLQKAGRLSTAVLSLHLNLVLFYYSSSASPASACASFATSWPDFTLSPSLTQTFSTVPSMVAITLVSIFIASITATG